MSKYQIESENLEIMRIFKSKKMQNLVVFMEPTEDASNISMKGGNMILNRFCIDEDAAFELSEVNYLRLRFLKLGLTYRYMYNREKGTEYSFLQSNFNFKKLIYINT